MKLIRTLGLAVALVASAASTSAQTAPAGWTVAKSATEWVATSPDQGRGLTVKLIYKTVQQPAGNLDLWFPEAHQRAAQSFGQIVNIGRSDSMGSTAESRLVASTISVKPPAGGRTSVLAYAYDTAQGRELVLIILPATLSRKNPAYRAAFAAMEDFWNARKVYAPAP
jgi:hypothetical protein